MADEEQRHPALKNFNRGVFAAKHIAGNTAKGALIGSAVGAVGLPLLTGGLALLASGPFAPIVAGIGMFTNLGAMAMGTAAAYGAVAGGVGFGGYKFATSVSNVDEAIDTREAEIVAQAERNEMRVQRREAMESQRANMHAAAEAQAASLHVTPPQALPVKPMDGQFLA